MLLVTCPFGLTSLLTTELKRLRIKPIDSFPNGCWIPESSRESIITINLQSRIANKVFLELGKGRASTFEELFQLVQKIDRAKHIQKNQSFRILATTKDSLLHAERSIQSIAHKAIATKLTGSKEGRRETNNDIPQLDIYIYIQKNIVHIMKNTSGESLHKRRRRVSQGEAPIKENLAIATLLSASRPFSQTLRDPCCGSGTLIIEAARFARNIASGKLRTFAFQGFQDFDNELYEKIKQETVSKEITKKRTIIGSDIDEEVLDLARRNAKSAGVDDIIQFVKHDILKPTDSYPLLLGEGLGVRGESEKNSNNTIACTIISNPPYGKRLDNTDTKAIHEKLQDLILQDGRHGALISGYEDAEEIFSPHQRKRKETRNGKDRVYIWMKKGEKR